MIPEKRFPSKQFPLKIWMILAVFCVAMPIWAASTDVLLLLPGFPGTAEQAQPYVDKMLRYLEGELSLAPGSMHGVFLTDGAEASSKLTSMQPGLALLGPSIYAASSGKMKMKVIARLTANGRGEQQYHVIVKKAGPDSLNALTGTVSGTVVHDDKYVLNVLLDGKVPAGKLIFQPNPRPLRALRGLASGKVDAVIVDDETLNYMGELEFAADLKKIYTTEPVPAPVVVVMNDGLPKAKQMKAALVGLCKGDSGKALCESLTISSITAASDADYKSLLKRYNR